MMTIFIEPKKLRLHNYERVVSTLPEVHFISEEEHSYSADVIMVYPEFCTDEKLDLYPNLKWIHLLTAGYETMDVQVVRKRDIILTNSRGVFSGTMAEDIIGKILMINRNTKLYLENMKRHIWYTPRNEIELIGSTVGIVGAGSIGYEVAKRLKAFETKIIGYKRTSHPSPYFDEIYTGPSGLKHVLSVSDYIIVSIPLNKDTYHLIDQEKFSWMKPSSVFINVARGDVIDQDALVEVLKEKRIRAAALDVTTPEPLPSDHPLWDLENIFITPHCSVASPMLYTRMTDLVIENISKYLRNQPLINIIID
jgi:D-2-hydroxyacid dehydrogenase (NADP+)